MVDSGLDSDTFNIVCAARLEESGLERTAQAVLGHFAVARRPFSWWVAPGDRPADLLRRLEGLGLERAESELAMALELDGLPGRPRASLGGLEIRRAGSRAELAEFARISAENWTPPDANVEIFYRRSADDLLRPDCPQRFFVARLEGVAVAAVEVTVAAGAAGVYNLSTRAAWRGRGIGSVLLETALRDAADSRRATAGVLQAAEAGVGLYRRLGFVQFGLITELKPPILSVR
jgi:GNAT superfamily N-acetyltransferase